ncbi:hypothetical protein KFE98_04265 [bacterium SCSIO 12741]|nr:hypothetical protein KFE98_04265 [bacterium SCSIO 12741]
MKQLPRLFMLLAVLLTMQLFLFPMWSITLVAPQYPDGITMFIWIDRITGDTEYTLQNINILNHYVGMKYIEPDSIPELQYFKYVVLAISLLGMGALIANRKYLYLSWFILVALLGALGIYDFYLWEYDYGHNLSETAPIKIPGMVYQPPLIGTKMLLNFEATSLPATGGWLFGTGLMLSLVAFLTYPKTSRR